MRKRVQVVGSDVDFFFLVTTGGLDPPVDPAPCYGHVVFFCCSCVERRLCYSTAGAALLLSSWVLCLWPPTKPLFSQKEFAKKFLIQIHVPERHIRGFMSWFSRAVWEQAGTYQGGWCWEAVGGPGLQWILLREDLRLDQRLPLSQVLPMDHHLPKTQATGWGWSVLSILSDFISCMKTRSDRGFWCGFHWSG